MLLADFAEVENTWSTIWLYNLNLIDGSGQAARPNSAVLLEGGKIRQVWAGPESYLNQVSWLENNENKSGLLKLDLQNRTVIPGLVDMHVHLRLDYWSLPYYLAYGVTSVRDCANNLQALHLLEQAIASGKPAGPRLFYSGPLFDGSPLSWPLFMSQQVTNEGQVDRAVAGLKQYPVDFIKLYTNLKLAEARRLIVASHEIGYYLTAHPGQIDIPALVDAGLDGVEHIFSLTRQIAPERLGKLGSRDNSSQVFGEIATIWDELGQKRQDDTELLRVMDLMANRGTYLTPTLAFNHQCSLPNQTSAAKKFTQNWQAADFERAKRSISVMANYVGLYRAMNGRLLVGSDTPNAGLVPGLALHSELALLAEAGLAPLEIIHLATQEAANLLQSSPRSGQANERFGAILPDYQADLLILEQDPSHDIRHCGSIRQVIKAGRFYQPAALLESARQIPVQAY